MILQLLKLILTTFIIPKPSPVRLEKKRGFADRYRSIILSILFVILLILLMGLFLAICFHVGGTESGVYYNKFGGNL